MWCSTVGVIVTLTLSILAAPLVTDAQPAGKVYRIGQLSSSFPPTDPNLRAGDLRQGLRDLGYVEGQNLIMEYRYAEGREERLPDLAAELVRLKVDVIVAGGPAIRAAQHATSTIPIVMAVSGDPVAQGYVASLARPGGNITGVSILGAEITGKRLEILKETVPQSTRIAVLAHPTATPAYGVSMNDLAVAARELGLHLHVLELRSPDELDAAFAAMTRAGADALFVQGEPLLLDGLVGGLWTSPPRVGCPRCTAGGCMWMLGASWPMDRACLTCTGVQPPIWTKS